MRTISPITTVFPVPAGPVIIEIGLLIAPKTAVLCSEDNDLNGSQSVSSNQL